MAPSHLSSGITVIHVDDSDIARAGVKAILSEAKSPCIEIIGEATNTADALALCEKQAPNVVLLELRLPSTPAIAFCRELVRRFSTTRILVLTTSADDSLVYEAVGAGAHGYLLKTVAAHELIEAVHSVAAGRSILDVAATGAVLRGLQGGTSSTAPNIRALSRQQRRVLELVTEGATNKEIGESLGLSQNTVRNYLVAVFEKLEVKTRAQAASLYSRQTAIAGAELGSASPFSSHTNGKMRYGLRTRP